MTGVTTHVPIEEGNAVVTEFRTLSDVVDQARLNLSQPVWNYIVGGANGERSLQANRKAFDGFSFVPQMFAGVRAPELSTSVFSVPSSMPIFVSPFSYDGAMHRGGYGQVAQAVREAGVTSILSEGTTASLEELAPEFGGQQGLVQFSLIGPDDHVLGFAERVAAAGYRGLCLTDVPTGFSRDHLAEAPLDLHGQFGMGNYGPGMTDVGVRAAHSSFASERWNWQRVASFVRRLPVPWILKGVLTAEDARRAVDLGATAVYMSNFGARNLDGMVPPMSRLHAVVGAVDGAVPVVIDSGFRRGTDVVKALALGASAVGIGRLGALGLAAGGRQGVLAVLRLLRKEVESVLGILGCSTPAELGEHHLVEAGPWSAVCAPDSAERSGARRRPFI